jgi:hypothetical protein
MMYDILKDLVSHTITLGNIEECKITGTDEDTQINAVASDRTVIIQGRFQTPIENFVGTFGLPNLAKLNTLLNIPEYKENANITVSMGTSGGETVPTGLDFINSAGDFKNNYRFMSKQLVEEKVRAVKFKGVNWDLEFEPNQAAILRLKYQAQAHAEESHFSTKVENGDLKFVFGDASSHAGNFVFQHGVSGGLTRDWKWPVNTFISILNLSGDKLMKVSNDGAAMIIVNSGLAIYEFIVPAQTK